MPSMTKTRVRRTHADMVGLDHHAVVYLRHRHLGRFPDQPRHDAFTTLVEMPDQDEGHTRVCGISAKRRLKASNPPADAPIPTPGDPIAPDDDAAPSFKTPDNSSPASFPQNPGEFPATCNGKTGKQVSRFPPISGWKTINANRGLCRPRILSIRCRSANSKSCISSPIFRKEAALPDK